MAALRSVIGSADNVSTDPVPIIVMSLEHIIAPLTLSGPVTVPPVPLRKFVSAYVLVTACIDAMGFCPSVRIAPEESVSDDPLASVCVAPAGSDKMDWLVSAMSAPLTIVRLPEKFCAPVVFARLNEVTIVDSETLFRDAPLDGVVSSRFVSGTVDASVCAVIAVGSSVALSTRLLRFAASTLCPVMKVVPLEICPICLCL